MSQSTPSGLRLMIYDATDVKSTLKLPPVGDGPAHQVEVNLGLTHSWTAGGLLYRALRRVDDYSGFSSWDEALDWLANYKTGESIQEIQYWGHGSPGYIYMNGQVLSTNHLLYGSEQGKMLHKIAERFTPDALVWFRTCATFGAESGQTFAETWANELKCRVAGHTHNVGFFQSGLHSLKPGEKASWSSSEGILKGTPAVPQKMKGSMPWTGKTITCLHGAVPKGW
jgi:hypothetical protein